MLGMQEDDESAVDATPTNFNNIQLNANNKDNNDRKLIETNVIDKDKLKQEIHQLNNKIKPLEFESYYEFFLLNTFKRGISESGKVNIDDLRSREHGMYYKRIKRSKNNSNKNANKSKKIKNNKSSDNDYTNANIKAESLTTSSRRRTRSQATPESEIGKEKDMNNSSDSDLADLHSDDNDDQNDTDTDDRIQGSSDNEEDDDDDDDDDEIEPAIVDNLVGDDHKNKEEKEISNASTSESSSAEKSLTNGTVRKIDSLPSSPEESDDIEDNLDKEATSKEKVADDSEVANVTLNNYREGKEEEGETAEIQDLYESIIPKIEAPFRRSDWLLPPRLRYVPEKQLRTKHVHTTIKINELVAFKRIRNVLSRFEGGVAGVRKRDWESVD
ncbi:Rfm1p NDAI_0E00830 [Naumovozyma dairenensis CBS 421]|uniref:Uncharacterized protein n=1 Tax=Naumovozyma dairenensis (strain ATCC 10597 / BCRC 20456 / CBS 421 / NBRC 0211 / NRRL Y-12639) TaxID=1071378 RepID=G0WAX9_NAUDC|nr:hypothetical protein NDAI_0E00830 [Naumovozyma dairenensis CBS 421]CCD24899.1 hypothetical protein NDAI_0E00830 [Naumovozyma dairenensis CBS 421]